MECSLTLYQFEWQGIAIAISHRKHWPLNEFSHIEITANHRLPMTETGYRSHFLTNAELSEFEGAQDYVFQWLNVTSQSKAWLAHMENLRQPSLFDFD